MLFRSINAVEYDGWLALEEEKVSVNWNDKSCIPNLAALYITPDDYHSAKTLSLETHPFYCDTSATVHISPEKNDFYNLHPVGTSRIVKGVGGSSISAIGIGDIKLRIAHGAHLTLKDVLYIPASTVTTWYGLLHYDYLIHRTGPFILLSTYLI